MVDNLNSSEDTAVVGRTSRIMLEHINISITHMTSNQNNTAPQVVCVEDLTILLNIVIRVNMTSTILWKR